ncbi:MAG: hypothetical protein PVG20_03145 [Thioalkalispiraceae bacterium]|jgi:hypothetical protein
MRKYINRSVPGVLTVTLLALFISVAYADDAWLIGKWQLSYDPDGSKTDYVEFKPDGDAISSGPQGEYEGFYIVSADSVKAVFTYKDKDFIMTFHFNEARNELRIVTSHTGKESIYKKIHQ